MEAKVNMNVISLVVSIIVLPLVTVLANPTLPLALAGDYIVHNTVIGRYSAAAWLGLSGLSGIDRANLAPRTQWLQGAQTVTTKDVNRKLEKANRAQVINELHDLAASYRDLEQILALATDQSEERVRDYVLALYRTGADLCERHSQAQCRGLMAAAVGSQWSDEVTVNSLVVRASAMSQAREALVAVLAGPLHMPTSDGQGQDPCQDELRRFLQMWQDSSTDRPYDLVAVHSKLDLTSSVRTITLQFEGVTSGRMGPVREAVNMVITLNPYDVAVPGGDKEMMIGLNKTVESFDLSGKPVDMHRRSFRRASYQPGQCPTADQFNEFLLK